MRASRVLSIPAGHRYTQAVYPDGVIVLDDPTDPWWPHPALDPEHLESVSAQVDVVHLHFGFEHRTPEHLAEWVEAVHRLGLVLVYTVHDLANPNVAGLQAHEDCLDVLIPGADELITLTESAADVIAGRWGRRARVIAHPPLVHGPIHDDTEPDLVGVHFKRVRPGTMPVGTAAPLLVDAARAHDMRLIMSIDHQADGNDIAALLTWSRATGVEVVVDEHRPDEEFAASLARLTVSVLPYRFGTHSGWLEACRDVGTRVVAPDCGHYASQWSDVDTFRCVDQQWDGASLSAAVGQALSRAAPSAPSADEQRQRRQHVAHQHEALLAAAVAKRPW